MHAFSFLSFFTAHGKLHMKILHSALLFSLTFTLFLSLAGEHVQAQGAPMRDEPRFADPVPSFQDKRDILDLGKLKEEVQRRYPRIRFDGSLDIQDISAPSDPQKRFEYTLSMLDLVSAWVALD